MVNDVGFVISKEEDLASGPGTGHDHSRLFYSRVLLKYKNRQRKLLTDIKRGDGECPTPASFSKLFYVC